MEEAKNKRRMRTMEVMSDDRDEDGYHDSDIDDDVID